MIQNEPGTCTGTAAPCHATRLALTPAANPSVCSGVGQRGNQDGAGGPLRLEDGKGQGCGAVRTRNLGGLQIRPEAAASGVLTFPPNPPALQLLSP